MAMSTVTSISNLKSWCRETTKGYKDVDVQNMTTSWADGLAFCALIHSHRPELVNYNELVRDHSSENLQLAFETAEYELGIPLLLHPSDLASPDELTILTYVSQLYNHFNSATDRKPLHSNGTAPSEKRKKTLNNAEKKLRGPKQTKKRIGDSCAVCKKHVYLVERLVIECCLYHRTCFRCYKCQAILKPNSYVKNENRENKYMCKSHVSKKRSTKTKDSQLSGMTVGQEAPFVKKDSGRKLSKSQSVNDIVATEERVKQRIPKHPVNKARLPAPPFTTHKRIRTAESMPERPPSAMEITPPNDPDLDVSYLKEDNYLLRPTSLLPSASMMDLGGSGEKPRWRQVLEKYRIRDFGETKSQPCTPCAYSMDSIKSVDTSRVENAEFESPPTPLSAPPPITSSVTTSEPHSAILRFDSFNDSGSQLHDPVDNSLSASNGGWSSLLSVDSRLLNSKSTESYFDSIGLNDKDLCSSSFSMESIDVDVDSTSGFNSVSQLTQNEALQCISEATIPEENCLSTNLDPPSDKTTVSAFSLQNNLIEVIEDKLRDASISEPDIQPEITSSEFQFDFPESDKVENAEIDIKCQRVNPFLKDEETPMIRNYFQFTFTAHTDVGVYEKLVYKDNGPFLLMTNNSFGDSKTSPNRHCSQVGKKRSHGLVTNSTPQTWTQSVNVLRAIPEQEISSEISELEEKLVDLESKGVGLELALRKEQGIDREQAWIQWFELINSKNQLVRRENELSYLVRQQELEEHHRGVENRLRYLMLLGDVLKTADEREEETELLEELVTIVNKRNAVVQSIEADRVREQQEDETLKASILGAPKCGCRARERSRERSLERTRRKKQQTWMKTFRKILYIATD